MSILFVGNTIEDVEYVQVEPTNDTGTEARDSAYSPQQIALFLHETNDPVGNLILNLDGPALSGEIWVHYRLFSWNQFSGVNADGSLIEVKDASNNVLGVLDLIDGLLHASARGSSTVDSSFGYFFGDTKLRTIDFMVRVAGTNTVCELYIDGALQASASTTTGSGFGIPTQVVLTNDDVISLNNNGYTAYFSELIVTDGEPTPGWRLSCRTPNAAGNYQQWTGNHVQTGDDNPATKASTDTSGQKLTSTPSTFSSPATPAGIRGVVTKAIADFGVSSDIDGFKHLLRISSTDYLSDKKTALQNMATWDMDPSDDTPWDTSELGSLEFGLQAEAS